MNDFTKLKVRDRLMLTGTIFTVRDKASHYLLEKDFPKLKGGIIYHCGPLIKDSKVISAGPTTSTRMNSFTPELIKKYDIKAIVGKGGMDRKVLDALKGRAVYFSAIGGAGALYAKRMKVVDVYMSEFGMPEAIWELKVENFPVIVTMDSNGNSIYEEIKELSKKKMESLKF